ncbi:uncharacterized protein [Clytia hemisphaerica]|uniref:SH2 domain-containing protein n=1 Tax=Clytia hemisphaerica TaxID=252671 RepID=A0A7M5WQ11_9CNID
MSPESYIEGWLNVKDKKNDKKGYKNFMCVLKPIYNGNNQSGAVLLFLNENKELHSSIQINFLHGDSIALLKFEGEKTNQCKFVVIFQIVDHSKSWDKIQSSQLSFRAYDDITRERWVYALCDLVGNMKPPQELPTKYNGLFATRPRKIDKPKNISSVKRQSLADVMRPITTQLTENQNGPFIPFDRTASHQMIPGQPVARPPRSPPANQNDLSQCDWYYGAVDRKDVAEILSKEKSGAYLLRDSKQRGSYALSFKEIADKITHVLLTKAEDGKYCISVSNVRITDKSPAKAGAEFLRRCYGGLESYPCRHNIFRVQSMPASSGVPRITRRSQSLRVRHERAPDNGYITNPLQNTSHSAHAEESNNDVNDAGYLKLSALRTPRTSSSSSIEHQREVGVGAEAEGGKYVKMYPCVDGETQDPETIGQVFMDRSVDDVVDPGSYVTMQGYDPQYVAMYPFVEPDGENTYISMLPATEEHRSPPRKHTKSRNNSSNNQQQPLDYVDGDYDNPGELLDQGSQEARRRSVPAIPQYKKYNINPSGRSNEKRMLSKQQRSATFDAGSEMDRGLLGDGYPRQPPKGSPAVTNLKGKSLAEERSPDPCKADDDEYDNPSELLERSIEGRDSQQKLKSSQEQEKDEDYLQFNGDEDLFDQKMMNLKMQNQQGENQSRSSYQKKNQSGSNIHEKNQSKSSIQEKNQLKSSYQEKNQSKSSYQEKNQSKSSIQEKNQSKSSYQENSQSRVLRNKLSHEDDENPYTFDNMESSDEEDGEYLNLDSSQICD